MRVVLFEGEDLASATASELYAQHRWLDLTPVDDPEARVGPHWSEQWVTVRLLVDADDVVCELRPGDRWDSWGIDWTGVSPDIPAGTAGVISWGGSASFDDFRIVEVE